MPWIRGKTFRSGLQPSDCSFGAANLGRWPRFVSGRAVGARFRKGHRPGLFEGQRPGLISAYGTAIGIGHQYGWRAESPVSWGGWNRWIGPSALGLVICGPFPGPSTQAGMVRTVGAQARHLRAPHSTHNHCRYPPQQPHAPHPPQFLIHNF